jgi:hypothetical protein
LSPVLRAGNRNYKMISIHEPIDSYLRDRLLMGIGYFLQYLEKWLKFLTLQHMRF